MMFLLVMERPSLLGHSLLRTKAQVTGVPLQQSQLLYLPAILQQNQRHRNRTQREETQTMHRANNLTWFIPSSEQA